MRRRLTRLSLSFILLLSSNVWAIGLGDIALESALNEPLRAEIALLSASPDELADLKVSLASAETFERYGIDRPVYLQGVEFNVLERGDSNSVVQIRSRAPISEPFLTFLIEATWSSGRLLREYTVLLDPPTYAPPAIQQAPAVEAPRRSTPSDSGQIERQAPTPVPTQAPVPAPAATAPAPQPRESARSGDTDVVDYELASEPESLPEQSREPLENTDTYSTTDRGDFYVSKGQTLWSVATNLRPDSRLTTNQTMLAIFEANPDAFGGNINMLKAGATLRIPSADEVFQINRNDALNEVRRQHQAWDAAWSGDEGYTAPETSSGPSLTLVPPDEEPAGSQYDDTSTYDTPSREEEIESRISSLEAADVPNQRSLIEIRDNELAVLRQELADIRCEVSEPPVTETVDEPVVDDPVVDEEPFVDEPVIDDSEAENPFAVDDGAEDEISDDVDDGLVADDAATTDEVDTDTSVSTDIIAAPTSDEDGILDRIIGFLTDWGIILGAVLVVAGGLIWFVRRGDSGGDEDDGRPWETLDSDEMDAADNAATQTIMPPTPEEAIVVVEQDSGVEQTLDDTVEAPVSEFSSDDQESITGSYGSIEDTFSSETAVNLDQSDPIAEADFHMAYGLYDQAADLINGALQTDSSDKALLSKLCEIYFVWGNRDEFVAAAARLKSAVGGEDSADWHKIVIMGQQIAADHELFSGTDLAGGTREVDLSFDDGGDDAGVLDMDFGAETDYTATAVDMDISEDATAEMLAGTMPAQESDEPSTVLDVGTSELPDLSDMPELAVAGDGQDVEATAEINLDELDLGVDDFSETEVAAYDDLDETGVNEAISNSGVNEALADLEDATIIGGMDEDADSEATEFIKGLDIGQIEDTGMRLAADETGQRPVISEESAQEAIDLDIDDELLEATGLTQVLSEDIGVETASGMNLGDDDATMLAPKRADNRDDQLLPADAETMLAPLDDDADDLDFGKTENLPPEAFTEGFDSDATVETPAIAGTDVDLDLDDLTAALQVSEIGDTMAQPPDDETVQQPRLTIDDESAESPTMELSPGAMGGELNDARTMTEVGTKLDLARAYVDMGDPAGARSILEEVLDEGDDGQKQQAQQLLDSLPS